MVADHVVNVTKNAFPVPYQHDFTRVRPSDRRQIPNFETYFNQQMIEVRKLHQRNLKKLAAEKRLKHRLKIKEIPTSKYVFASRVLRSLKNSIYLEQPMGAITLRKLYLKNHNLCPTEDLLKRTVKLKDPKTRKLNEIDQIHRRLDQDEYIDDCLSRGASTIILPHESSDEEDDSHSISPYNVPNSRIMTPSNDFALSVKQ